MDSEPKRILQDAISLAWRGEVLSRIEEVRRGEAATESYSDVKRHLKDALDSTP